MRKFLLWIMLAGSGRHRQIFYFPEKQRDKPCALVHTSNWLYLPSTMVFPRKAGRNHTFYACKSLPTKHTTTLRPNVSRPNFTAIKRELTYMFHLSASHKSYKEVLRHNKHITPGYYSQCERAYSILASAHNAGLWGGCNQKFQS